MESLRVSSSVTASKLWLHGHVHNLWLSSMQLLSYMSYVWSKKVSAPVSEHCVVFVNALCPTINCNNLALLEWVLLKVFSVTLTLLMEQKLLAGCCFMVGDKAGQSDPRQWGAECETTLNQGWSSDGPRQARGLPKPDFLDLCHLKWKNSSWIGSCLISYTNVCSDHKCKCLFALFP